MTPLYCLTLIALAGSLVDEFPREELFDVSQNLMNVRRRMKRATCRLTDMTLTDCYERKVTCVGGCSFQDSKYDCDSPVWNCQYILVCKPTPEVSKRHPNFFKSKP